MSYEGGSKEKSLKSTARTPKSKKVSLGTGVKSQIQSRNVSGLNSMAQSTQRIVERQKKTHYSPPTRRGQGSLSKEKSGLTARRQTIKDSTQTITT